MTIFEALAAPFDEQHVLWRVARCGLRNGQPWAQVLPYIDARAVRARLNAVVGPAHWQVAYSFAPTNGVLATLALRLDGEWIPKQDGSGIPEIEPVKGAISSAFRRVAATWGIGEYLYGCGTLWAQFGETGRHRLRIDGQTYRWNPPALLVPTAVAALMTAQGATAAGLASATGADSGGLVLSGPQPRGDNPVPGEALDVPIPFGRYKGRTLRDVLATDPAHVRSSAEWARARGRFTTYVAAVDTVLSAA